MGHRVQKETPGKEVLREFKGRKVSLVLQGLLVPKVIPEREDRKAFRGYRVKLVPLGLPVQREILAHRDHKVFKGNVEKKAILVLREKKVTQVLKVLRE